MATIKVVIAENTPWISSREAARRFTDDVQASLTDAELGSAARHHHPGDDAHPQMFEVAMQPDQLIPAHAHECDEIILVLEGELLLGRQVLTAGASVFVPAGTLYSFRSGPAGLRFMNFRPRNDLSYITKPQFMERRSAARAGDE